jgi:hypothetical protein
LLPYKEKDNEQDEEEFIDFYNLLYKYDEFAASITRSCVYNEVVSPDYIAGSNNESEKDNFESLVFIEKCSSNIQE